MTLALQLTPELEERLLEEAKRHGLPVDAYTLRLLDAHLPRQDRRNELMDMLRSWIEEDDAREQRETREYLIRALDEDRPSERKLFPPDLKGVTW